MGFISNTQLKSVVKKQVDSLKDGSLVPAKSLLTDNFDTKKVLNDQSAYNFRPTASMGTMSLEVGSPCKEKAIVGGSLGWNQLLVNSNFSGTVFPTGSNSYDSGTDTNTFSITTGNLGYGYLSYDNFNAVKDHYYFMSFTIEATNANYIWAKVDNQGDTPPSRSYSGKGNYAFIQKSGQTARVVNLVGVSAPNGTTITGTVTNINIIDITALFGSTIANYIVSLGSASGVAWFRRYFPKPYYAYKAIGDFTSVVTSGKKITRFNQWDEEWELGTISTLTGENENSIVRIRSKNYIPVIPNVTYYYKQGTGTDSGRWCCYDKSKAFVDAISVSVNSTFTIPNNVYFIRFSPYTDYGTTYNHDICINLHYDGERDGEYEPFSSTTVPVDPITLIGIPKLDANNNLYFDGNRYNSDGTVEEKWNNKVYSSSNVTEVSASYVNIKYFAIPKPTDYVGYGSFNSAVNKLFVPKYSVSNPPSYDNASYIGTICANATNDRFWIGFPTGTTLAQAQAQIDRMEIIYLLATPTTGTPATPFTEVQDVDNWGTEELLPPENDTRPVVVPVGHDTDYLPDYKAKVEVAADMPGDDGDYILHREDGECSFTPLVTSSILITYQDGTTETVRVLS